MLKYKLLLLKYKKEDTIVPRDLFSKDPFLPSLYSLITRLPEFKKMIPSNFLKELNSLFSNEIGGKEKRYIINTEKMPYLYDMYLLLSGAKPNTLKLSNANAIQLKSEILSINKTKGIDGISTNTFLDVIGDKLSNEILNFKTLNQKSADLKYMGLGNSIIIAEQMKNPKFKQNVASTVQSIIVYKDSKNADFVEKKDSINDSNLVPIVMLTIGFILLILFSFMIYKNMRSFLKLINNFKENFFEIMKQSLISAFLLIGGLFFLIIGFNNLNKTKESNTKSE